MLKKRALKKIMISSLALVIMLLFCFFPKNNTLTVPEEVIYVEELTMPIYALDQNGYVARSMALKKDNNDEIKYIINTLTIGKEESKLLSLGFTPLLPTDTEVIDYTIEDKILKINFTKDFLNISERNFEKMLESLVFSLCELDGIKGLIIYVENTLLEKIPGQNNNLPKILDRKMGINKKYDITTLKDSQMTTTYYMSKKDDEYYYIPISKITSEKVEPVEVIISTLKSTPIYETNLISFLNASYELKEYEVLENSITLSFNNSIIAGLNDEDINEKVKYTLALSLRDTYDIDDINININ